MDAPELAGSRILIVDDEPGPRESLRMLLKSSYDVRVAESGLAALAEVAGYRPDLVILDIKMPEMNGVEILRRVKAHDPSIEVVMITAYASLATVKQALMYGAFEYVIKPFSRADVGDVVRRALVRRHHEIGAHGALSRLVGEMRQLSAKTLELEEAARHEATEQSLRITQLSILREISRAFVGHLDAGVAAADQPADVAVAEIRDAEGVLGTLVVDNRASGRAIDPRERELLEMLAEYLAIALRNSRLYAQIAERFVSTASRYAVLRLRSIG